MFYLDIQKPIVFACTVCCSHKYLVYEHISHPDKMSFEFFKSIALLHVYYTLYISSNICFVSINMHYILPTVVVVHEGHCPNRHLAFSVYSSLIYNPIDDIFSHYSRFHYTLYFPGIHFSDNSRRHGFNYSMILFSNIFNVAFYESDIKKHFRQMAIAVGFCV